MVEKTTRYRAAESNDGTENDWHVFVRETADDRPRHVGSLVAANADDAHETATRLFAWYAHEVWVCRTSDVVRYVAEPTAGAEHATPQWRGRTAVLRGDRSGRPGGVAAFGESASYWLWRPGVHSPSKSS